MINYVISYDSCNVGYNAGNNKEIDNGKRHEENVCYG